MASEYDEIADELFPKSKPMQSGYQEDAEQLFGPNKDQFESAKFVAKQKQPDQVSEAQKLSREFNVPVHFVEENLDQFKKAKDPYKYEEIAGSNPRSAKFLSDPMKASMAKDDVPFLKKTENALIKIRPYEDKPFYLSDLASAGEIGINQLKGASAHLAMAYGLADPGEYAEYVAEQNRRAQEINEKAPRYVKEFNKVMEKQMKDVDQALSAYNEGYEAYKQGRILDALIEYGSGTGMAAAESVDLIASALVRPRATLRATTESLAFSAPSLTLGAAGAFSGAATGAYIGGTTGAAFGGIGALPGIAIGSTVGGVAGGLGGMFIGSTATETGAWINNALSERGYDITNADDIKKAYSNPQLMAEIKGEAERKGLTTAAVDTLFAAFAGGSVAKAVGVKQTLKAGVKEVGVQSVGEAASEFAGQVAAREGDMSKVSLGESIFEGVVSMGQSVTEVAGGAAIRSALSGKQESVAIDSEIVDQEAVQQIRSEFSENVVDAAEEVTAIAKQSGEATATAMAIMEAREAYNESKLKGRDPETAAQFIDDLGEGAPAEVYFQKDEFDQFWRDRQESPVEQAEALLAGGGTTYFQSLEGPEMVKVKVSDLITKVEDQGYFEDIVALARKAPDAMTAEQAAEAQIILPKLMKVMAEEAKVEKDRRDQVEQDLKVVKDQVVSQLKEAGRNPIEAEALVSIYRTLAIREGLSPQALAQEYGLNIVQATESAQVQDETVLEQAGEGSMPGSRNIYYQRDSLGFFSKLQKTLDEKLQGKSASADQIRGLIKDLKPEEIEWSGINEFLEGKKKVSKEELMEFLAANQLQIEEVTLSDSGTSEDIYITEIEPDEPGDVLKKAAQDNNQEFVEANTATVHEMPVTDKMREVVQGEGFSLFQQEKGRIRISPNKKFTIELMQTADQSTFLHEAGHYWLEVVKGLAAKDTASQGLKDDFQSILDYLGVESADQIGTKEHELWARSFEAYLREGKAPSNRLRKAFNTFKVWLIQVYRNVLQLDAPINQEIRDVMDRLFATEEEINEARKTVGDTGLFTGDMIEQMPAGFAEKYQEAMAKAKTSAEERMQKRLLKDREKTLKKKTAELKKRITDEINDQRVYNAISILKTGKMADGSEPEGGVMRVQLDKAEFNEFYSEFADNENFKGLFGNKNPMSADLIAPMLGYASGDDMILEIANAPNKADLIEFTVNQEAARLADDIMGNEEELKREAIDAIHNMDREKRIRMEYEALADESIGFVREATRRVARRPQPRAAIKELARKHISEITVGELKPNQYRLAERKYAKMAGQALAKGDIKAAFDAKEKELINFELYRASSEARQKVEKGRDQIKKFFKPNEKLVKTREIDFIDAGRALLARFGFRRGFANEDKNPLDYIAKIKAYNEEGYEIISAIISGIVDDSKDFTELTFAEYQDFMDAIQALWDESRNVKTVEIQGKKMLIEEASNELQAQMERFNPGKRIKDELDTEFKDEKFMRTFVAVKSIFRRFEHWVDLYDDGEVTGAFRKYLFQPLQDAVEKFESTNKTYQKKFNDLARPIADKIDYRKKISAPEINTVFKDKSHLLGALYHTGNESNLRKLLLGYGWGSKNEDGSLNTANWDAFIQRMYREGVITKEDMDFVQALWDLNEEVKPIAQKGYKKVYGFYFDEIPSKKIETPFGTYRGGYAPATPNRDAPQVQQILNARVDAEKMFLESQYNAQPTAGGGGFGKGRVESFSAPLSLDIGLASHHISEVLRFSIVKPAVIDAYKIVQNREFNSTLEALEPGITQNFINPTFNRVDKNITKHKVPFFQPLFNVFNTIARNVAMQFLVANTVNIVEQYAALFITASKVKPKYLIAASANYMTTFGRGIADEIASQSDYMSQRYDSEIRDINKSIRTLFEEKSKFKKLQEWTDEHGFLLQRVVQHQVDSIVWQAAYNEQLEINGIHKDAVAAADAAVRTTQADQSPISKSILESYPVEIMAMFLGFFNNLLNLNVSEAQKIIYSDMQMSKKVGAGFYLYMTAFFSVAVLGAALRKAASGGLDEDDDGELSDDIKEVFVDSQLKLFSAMIPVAGKFVDGFVAQTNDKFYDNRVGAAPPIEILFKAGMTSGEMLSEPFKDGQEKRQTKDVLMLLGTASGIPLAPAGRPIGYLMDVESGKAQPSGPIDFTRGIITGKPGVQ
jgi:hypothetical protein